MEYLLLTVKIYFTLWLLFCVYMLAYSWIPSNNVVNKFLDKLVTISLAVLLYAGALLLLLVIFLKVWELI